MSETVEQKAERLFSNGAVQDVLHYDRVYYATIRGDHGVYQVCVTGSGYTRCTCKAGSFKRNGHKPCAHVLALLLYRDSQP